jgi:mono/diheme cytochrome c family protein
VSFSGRPRNAAIAVCAAALLAVGPTLAGPSPAPFKARQLSAFDRRKAELLLDTRLACRGCHELNGSGGRIAPRLTDVRARRSPDYIYAMIGDPQGTVPGTIMPRQPMDDRTRELIANYLLALEASPRGGGAGPAARPQPDAPATGDAAAVYGRFCGPCHGVRGGGDGFNAAFLPVRPAPHASKAHMSTRSDDALFDTIAAGGYIMNRSNFMPPFGATLSREQIRALVQYIRRLCGCKGPAWSRANNG